MSRKKSQRSFKPKFENGGFWEYYVDLEHQFEDFLEYVPYVDKNEKACSFRLVNLLLGIGGHIDSAFKEMAFYRGFSRKDKDRCKDIRQKVTETRRRLKAGLGPVIVKIEESLAAFEGTYRLSQREVIFKRLPERETIVPFVPHNRKTNAPEWWEIYNGLKHDFGLNFEKANLAIVRDALAGAFLLNVIHEPAILRLNDYGLLDWQAGLMPVQQLKDVIKKKQKLYCSMETELFLYDYEQ